MSGPLPGEPMTTHALTDERVAEMLNNRAASTVAGWDYELRCAMLATLDARDSALNHERVISADLRENLKASQAHHAAADEEIKRLRDDIEACRKDMLAEFARAEAAEARVAQLEAALEEERQS